MGSVDYKMMTNDKTTALANRYIDECSEYSHPSEREGLILDWKKKEETARHFVTDFERRAGSVKGKRILDLGFGNGMFSIAFAEAGAVVSGVEVNSTLCGFAQEIAVEHNLSIDFRAYDGAELPFEKESFDYAYSTSVIEHVSDPYLFLSEAYRVLKPGGRFYLSFPNRWRPREAHTRLWFIGYLPSP